MAGKGGRQLSLHRGSYGTRTSHLTRPSTTSKPGARSRPSASGARCERGGGCLCSTTGITHTCMRHSRTKPNSGSDASERWFFNRLCFKLGATLCSAVLFKCTCSTRLASKQATVRERVCVCVSLCLSVCVCDEHAQSGSTTTASNAKGFGAWGRGRGKKVLWQGRPTTSSHRKHGSSEQVEKGSGAWAHHHHQVAKGGGCVWVWVHRQWCRNHHNGSDWTRTRAAFLLQ